MTWALWTSFVLVSTANIITPGPAILNTIRRAVQLGFKRMMPTILGNALGLGVAGLFCAGGVAAFVLTSEILWQLFRWFGVIYMAWLGLKLIVLREEIELGSSAPVQTGPLTLFLEAFMLAVTNPKAILFYIALFPQVMVPDQPLMPQSIILVVTYCAISITSLSSYSLIASMIRSKLLTRHRYQIFRYVSGLILLVFAGKLARDVLR